MAAVADKAVGADDQFIRRQPEASEVYHRQPEASEVYQSDVRKLVDLISNLNPAAEEFFPSNYTVSASAAGGTQKPNGRLSADAPIFVAFCGYGDGPISNGGNSRDSSSDGSSNNQLNRQVTEEKLAEIFSNYGQVVDCRICGDPHSILRFAFVEFSDEDGAMKALNLDGAAIGCSSVKVLPSKTAIIPVNQKFLPKSKDENDMVIRTVYCTNIDKKVTQTDVRTFFEQCCGEVSRLRLLGDNVHSTRIAFVEFVQAESAITALTCSGMILGALPIRVNPSKTPVRPRMPRFASS
ncbi:polyadenylate-binding protein-interacting protein 11-like isoform X2 [Zingiber officinale]|uniref:polyadenylate-binding protein-interacting protein 11-like isoform X2 n=1 Tax=Zingiber officinale TaxID=94328 RepID=UPI001C4DA270|nr:polyadenylate-binding protein-interacting protein 11-like isoform X2 [Zingiber officinale]